MAAKIIHAVQGHDGYHLLVHLDTERVVSEEEAEELKLDAGSPHPDYLREWTWGLPHTAWRFDEETGTTVRNLIHMCGEEPMTDSQYLDGIKEMLPGMVAEELKRLHGLRPNPETHALVTELHGREI